jgi:DNA topoisomerase-1
MIYDRFLATQMSDAVYEVKEALIESSDGRYEFKGEATRLKFPGHQRAFSEIDSPVTKGALPDLKAGEKALLLELIDEKKFTEPPGRYSEASLIKKLEVNGIGRPSTYAKILQTLFERQYAERERGRLFPTELAMIVNKVLISRFSDIFALPFTASMEEELDLVEEGHKQWQDVVKKFYDPFIVEVKAFESAAPDIKKSLITKTDRTCPQCGHALIIKWGRYGKFYSCEKFPDCKYTEPLEQQAKYCPKCNSPMVLKAGRFGRFFACTKYPECKHTERFSLNRAARPSSPDQ